MIQPEQIALHRRDSLYLQATKDTTKTQIMHASVKATFSSLTLGAHAQRGLRSWVCLSVCLSVKSYLTSDVSVHPENAVTYSESNEGENI